MEQSRSLAQVLNELPEWSNDSQMHALFCEYDGDESEEFMLEFWKRAIDKVFNGHIPSLHSTIDELRVLFDRKGRKPLCIGAICTALEQKSHLIDIDTLRLKVQEKRDRELTWGSWIGKKILGSWKEKFQPKNIFICQSKMQQFSREIVKWARSSKRSVYKLAEISDHLQYTYKFKDEDVKYLLDYLYIEDLAVCSKVPIAGKPSEIVKFKLNEEDSLNIKEKDTANLALTEVIQEIEVKVEKLEASKDQMHQMILDKIRKRDKIGAKPYLIRKKMIEKKIDELNASRNHCEQQLFSLETSADSAAIFHAMREATITQENQRISLDEVQDLMERNKDIYTEQQEISTVLAAQDPVEQQELLEELDRLDALDINIESPPVHKLPTHSIPANQFEESKVPQRKANMEVNWE